MSLKRINKFLCMEEMDMDAVAHVKDSGVYVHESARGVCVVCVRESLCACARMRACINMCVCVVEREREREHVIMCACVFLCVCDVHRSGEGRAGGI